MRSGEQPSVAVPRVAPALLPVRPTSSDEMWKLQGGSRCYLPHSTALRAARRTWRGKAHRSSCLDLVTRLRQEIVDHPESPQPLGFQPADRALTQAADARESVRTYAPAREKT
jgi:hypothetical protein